MTNPINIDVWLWRLAASPADRTRWQTYLDATEQARRSRFLFEQDRDRFTVCRAYLRRVLGHYTATNPRDIRFATTGREKPVLAAEPRPHFNLSHTGALAGVAVVDGHPVGFDLERRRPVDDDFIAYALNPAEHAAILGLDAAARAPAFLRYWTAKESYLKCIGTGLWQSLKTFDVAVPLESPTPPGTHVRAALPRIDDPAGRARNWHLYSFEPTPEHIGAFAVALPDGAQIAIRTRWLGNTGRDARH